MDSRQDERAVEPGQWASYNQAKEAIEFMTLAELEAWDGKKAPDLLPYSGIAIGVGILFLVIGIQISPLVFVGLLVGFYGIVAIASNRTRASVYKEDIYRRWVQDRASRDDLSSDEPEALP
jgi:hypothetical protein